MKQSGLGQRIEQVERLGELARLEYERVSVLVALLFVDSLLKRH